MSRDGSGFQVGFYITQRIDKSRSGGLQCFHTASSSNPATDFVAKIMQEGPQRKCPRPQIAWVEVGRDKRQEPQDILRTLGYFPNLICTVVAVPALGWTGPEPYH